MYDDCIRNFREPIISERWPFWTDSNLNLSQYCFPWCHEIHHQQNLNLVFKKSLTITQKLDHLFSVTLLRVSYFGMNCTFRVRFDALTIFRTYGLVCARLALVIVPVSACITHFNIMTRIYYMIDDIFYKNDTCILSFLPPRLFPPHGYSVGKNISEKDFSRQSIRTPIMH